MVIPTDVSSWGSTMEIETQQWVAEEAEEPATAPVDSFFNHVEPRLRRSLSASMPPDRVADAGDG